MTVSEQRTTAKPPPATTPQGTGRWQMVAAGTILQLCLGTVYAWSFFQNPLIESYGWKNAQVMGTFSLAIFCLGLASAAGGVVLPRTGPRALAVAGGLLFGSGYGLAALALSLRSLPLLYVGYGLIGGIGLGLGYVTPVATVAKWFPDKKGLATGIVIMGFGLGALVLSKLVAPLLMQHYAGNLVPVFAWLGVGLGSAAVLAALLLKNPPTAPASATKSVEADQSPGAEAGIVSRRFALMWGMFFCNILAGISIISFQSPLLQDLWKTADPSRGTAALAEYGATLIAVSSLFNGLGRLLWGGLSDRLGRLTAFRLMLGSQLAAFGLLAVTGNPWLLSALVCYVLLCYGGGFGTMPALVLDTFGSRRMAAVYGAVLTAWSAGGVAGPQLVAALKDAYGASAGRYAFTIAAGFIALGLVLAFSLRSRR